jgi:hypothetical protein
MYQRMKRSCIRKWREDVSEDEEKMHQRMKYVEKMHCRLKRRCTIGFIEKNGDVAIKRLNKNKQSEGSAETSF